MLLAVAIVHDRTTDASVMPWVIASQTIPILAIAPMIIVVLNSVGIAGLLPKALISMYLSFFPVAVGMVKGLRSPDRMQLDQMRTWNATAAQTFRKLRWPAATPYLFASLKVAAAASLVGAIVGELPTGAVAGLGARMLSGSYYGQTVQIWSALMMAAILAAALVGADRARRAADRAGDGRAAVIRASGAELEARRTGRAPRRCRAGRPRRGPSSQVHCWISELRVGAVGLEVDRGGDAVAHQGRQGEVAEHAFLRRHVGLEAVVVAEAAGEAACAG